MVTKVRSILEKTKAYSLDVARKVAVAKIAPSEKQARMILFTAGMLALGFSLSHESFAQGIGNNCLGSDPNCVLELQDGRIGASVKVVLDYLEGSLGALIMAIAGLVAIAAAAFGQYKAALQAMAVAIGAFILRSVMNTFFNVQSIPE